jgi:hypothetical protein
MVTSDQYLFTSTSFPIEPGEESETNPECYGKSLATWMSQKLTASSVSINEEIIAEDWGWLVMVQRKPFRLWVGCGTQKGDDYSHIPNKWVVFVAAEPNLLNELFKQSDIQSSLSKLTVSVEEILKSNSEIIDLKVEPAP